MPVRPLNLLLVVLWLSLVACSPQDDVTPTTSLELIPVKEFVFENLLTPSTMDLDANGNVYIIDRKEKHIKVFSPEGHLLNTIGSAGRGPGEFTSPTSLDVQHQRIVVGDISGRMTLFDLQGSYISSFVVPEIRHLNSDIKLVNDSLIVVGGLVLGRDYWDGTLLHLFGVDGIKRHSFGPLSSTAHRMESVALSGARFDFEEDMNSFWVVQTTEYTLYNYNLDGELVDSLHLEPAYFRPLRDKEPDNGADYPDWLAAWDRPVGVFSVNDSMLVVNVQIGRSPGDEPVPSKVDVIRKRDGYLYHTFETEETLRYVDDNGHLFFQRPTTEEAVARFRVYRLAFTSPDPN